MRVNHHQRPNAIACKRMRDAHDARARSIVLMCLCVRCDDMTRSRSSSTSSSSHSNESSSTITTPYHRTHRPSMSVHWVLSARDDIFVNEWMNVRRTRGQPMRVHAVMRRVNTNQCTYVSWSCIVYSLLYYTICGGVCCIILYSCGYRWTEHDDCMEQRAGFVAHTHGAVWAPIDDVRVCVRVTVIVRVRRG